jgi:hypothetical protein
VYFLSYRIQIYPCTDGGSIASSSSMYTWIAYPWSYAGSYFVPQDWGFSYCQMSRGFLFFASGLFLFAVGRGTQFCFGSAAGSFAQSFVLAWFLSRCIVIPDLNRLLVLQATLTLGAFACLTGMYWSARRSLANTEKDTLPSRALVSKTLLPIEDVNALIELTPGILVVVTIIGLSQSA